MDKRKGDHTRARRKRAVWEEDEHRSERNQGRRSGVSDAEIVRTT